MDVVLIGGGIMSATLGTLLTELEPTWTIKLYERLDRLALESSDPWNNAGTGHSALCELNYTPQTADGRIDISKALTVNEQFQISRQLWSFLVESGRIPDPKAFINSTPHMSFVWGEENVDYLRKRYEALKDHPLFVGIEFSDDPAVIAQWAPLLMQGREPGTALAATRSSAGTDVDFGALTTMLTESAVESGMELVTGADVHDLWRTRDGNWYLEGRLSPTGSRFFETARFVFVGAGGYALPLLQKSGIKEIRGFGGFPVSGLFLRTDDPALVGRHQAKVYGQPPVGAPPMSVPHLDTRVIGTGKSLMFGPYAGWSPKFLKTGSMLDLFASVKPRNLIPMVLAGLKNIPLTVYLIKQLASGQKRRMQDLREFFPAATPDGWTKVIAGQRVQVIRPDGVLQFGTEVVTSADGSIAGLLGASPGASTAVPIMLQVLERCFPEQWDDWQPTLTTMVPERSLGGDAARTAEVIHRTAKTLQLSD
ncbi:malate:quinone oxidoreductase [soil metagenome]